jgi:multiple sugar transport system permease protein/raffinose/stachyose/melibiose transport system permease protein
MLTDIISTSRSLMSSSFSLVSRGVTLAATAIGVVLVAWPAVDLVAKTTTSPLTWFGKFTIAPLPGSDPMPLAYLGLVIAFLALTVPIAIWLFRSFLQSIPRQLEEAAYIEGASKVTAFWKVVVPLLQPAVGATGAYVFFLTWQDFLFPLVIMTGKSHRTLPIGIMDCVGQYETNWGNLMASSILIILPVIIIFTFIQKQLIAGLIEGAIKE